MDAYTGSSQNGRPRRETAKYVGLAGLAFHIVVIAIWMLPAVSPPDSAGSTPQTGRASYYDYGCAILVCISLSVAMLGFRQAGVAELQRRPSIVWSLGYLAFTIGGAMFMFGVRTPVFVNSGEAPVLMRVESVLLLTGAFVVFIDVGRMWVTRKAERARRDAGTGAECRPAR